MKGRIIRTTLLLTILFLASEITIAGNTQAEHIISTNNENQIITVDKNGEGDYTTIQEAINNTLEGSTIYVKTGTYNEIIIIKKNINLIGEDKDKTIINPISGKNKYAIRVGAPEVKISKLSITNGAPGLYTTGIYVSASNTEIEDCNIYDTPIGIAVWTSNNNINNCNFWGCKDEGIAFLGSTNSKCDNNKVTSCTFYKNCDGIELQYSSNNIIANCEFCENTHTGINAIASSNNKNTISNCTIYNSQVNGIYLSSSSDNQIIDCTISDNKDGNIITTKNSYNNEIKNTKSNTYKTELTTEENPASSKQQNNIRKNTKNGILNAISNIKINNYDILLFYMHIAMFF